MHFEPTFARESAIASLTFCTYVVAESSWHNTITLNSKAVLTVATLAHVHHMAHRHTVHTSACTQPRRQRARPHETQSIPTPTHTHTHTRRLERRTSLTFMLTFSSLRDLPCSPVHLPQSLHREAFCSDVADCLEAASFLRDKLQLQPPRRGHRYSCRPGDLPGSPSPGK